MGVVGDNSEVKVITGSCKGKNGVAGDKRGF